MEKGAAISEAIRLSSLVFNVLYIKFMVAWLQYFFQNLTLHVSDTFLTATQVLLEIQELSEQDAQ